MDMEPKELVKMTSWIAHENLDAQLKYDVFAKLHLNCTVKTEFGVELANDQPVSVCSGAEYAEHINAGKPVFQRLIAYLDQSIEQSTPQHNR